MLDEYEFYQGAVLRQLVVGSLSSITITPFVREGRISAFILNGRIGVHIKHSSKRMSPWRFSFTIEQAADLLDLEARFPTSFAVFVCETDGLVTLGLGELHDIVSFQETEHAWVRIDRPPRSQYGISGNKAELRRKVPRGIDIILNTYLESVRILNARQA